MKIIWDDNKYRKLKSARNIDLDEIKILLESRQYFEILENPSRKDQFIIPLFYQKYVHIIVIKIIDDELVIKTCYPSRKAHKKYFEEKI
jgi:uncharacterized DUF497 family protein